MTYRSRPAHVAPRPATGTAAAIPTAAVPVPSGAAPARFQPCVDAVTGRLHAVHVILPGRPAARVVEAALKQERAWREDGRDVRVAVSLCGAALRDPGLPAQVELLRELYRTPADALVLGARAGELPGDAGALPIEDLWVELDAGASAVRSARQEAHARELRLVVQHVDRSWQREALLASGCAVLQGELVCAPVPAEVVPWWLDARAALVSAAR